MRKSMLLLGMSLLAAPLAAQQSQSAMPNPSGSAPQASDASAATTSGPAKVAVGASVSDAQGGAVGTIASVDGGNATIDTGSAKAAVPVSSFAQGQNGLVLGMTKAQLEAAVAKAKPAEIQEKMIAGKVNKTLSEISLTGQPYVLDTNNSVENVLKSAKAEVVAYNRLAVGEGIEKVVEDYAAEVMKQAGLA